MAAHAKHQRGDFDRRDFQMVLDHAIALYQKGNPAQAMDLLEPWLSGNAVTADGWNLAAVLAQCLDRSEDAHAYIRHALELENNEPRYLNTLANILWSAQRREEALAAVRTAISVAPGYAEGHFNLANMYADAEQFADAAAHFESALRIDPQLASAANNFGNLLRRMGRRDAARSMYQRALRGHPDFLDALCNMGNLHHDDLDYAGAARCYSRAVAAHPRSARAHYNLGLALHGQGDMRAAAKHYARARELDPRDSDAANNLGNVYRFMGRLEAAAQAFRDAIQLAPEAASPYNNLAGVMKDQGLLDEARTLYETALARDPEDALARSNLILMQNYGSHTDPRELFEVHRDWARQFANPLANRIAPHRNSVDPERRLRIGYVSPDFRTHSVAFFIEPLLAGHDRASLDVYCYSDVSRPDAVTRRLRGLVEGWRDIQGQSDAQVAKQIRRDQIDILIDLAGHSAKNRLMVFARKPAPVQVTYLGYPNTTGLSAMDYRITDDWCDPPGTTEHLHTEHLLRLPGGFLAYRPPPAPEVRDPPALANGYVTFGSFNNRTKVTEEVISVWAEILNKIPESRLIMKSRGLDDSGTRGLLRKQFAAHDIDLGRIELLGYLQGGDEHLATYHRVDIALDTFPYNGTTTTCEALWMGVPSIVLAGKTHVARVGYGLLNAVGLGEFVAQDAAAYVALAQSLSRDIPRLNDFRHEMRRRMQASDLMNEARLCRCVDDGYREIWRTYCARTMSANVGVHRGKLPEWIFMAGMPRSASTWTYNIVRELLHARGLGDDLGFVGETADLDKRLSEPGDPDVPRLVKFHVLTDSARELLNAGRAVAVFSQRDVRDVVVSLMQFNDCKFDDVFPAQVDNLLASHDNWSRAENVIRIDYQRIMDEPAGVVAELADRLGLELRAGEAHELARAWSLAETRQRIASIHGHDATLPAYGSGRHAFYDPATLLHPNHIASGGVGRFRQDLPAAQAQLLNSYVEPWLISQGYAPGPDDCAALSLRLRDGSSIYIPGNINLLTPYVLLEQEDWFESELDFLRGWVRPGMRCLDIGANFGLYTINLARLVGESGEVVAFEPSHVPAEYLAHSIQLNALPQVRLVRAALSDTNGRGRLADAMNAELNHLAGASDEDRGDFDTVRLLRLDDCEALDDGQSIDFVKLDAEGHESNILDGARNLLRRHSPVIMYEYKHGETINHDLAARLGELGFDTYRLVPHLGLLAPCDPEGGLDPFQLNLFAVSADRARILAAEGTLLLDLDDDPGATFQMSLEPLGTLPFAQRLASRWATRSSSRSGQDSLTSVARILFAMDADHPPLLRYQALTEAYELLAGAVTVARPRLTDVLTFARAASMLGMRGIAVQLLDIVLGLFEGRDDIDIDQPFLCPNPAFDTVDPGDDVGAWLLSAVIDQREQLRAFSSYFTGDSGLDRLDMLAGLGFMRAPMERRRQLMRLRSQAQTEVRASELLMTLTPDNLNPGVWASGRVRCA